MLKLQAIFQDGRSKGTDNKDKDSGKSVARSDVRELIPKISRRKLVEAPLAVGRAAKPATTKRLSVRPIGRRDR